MDPGPGPVALLPESWWIAVPGTLDVPDHEIPENFFSLNAIFKSFLFQSSTSLPNQELQTICEMTE